MDNFELLRTTLVYDRIPVSEYCSRETGLTVFIVEFAGPTIHGGFYIATEAFDDDGQPNALRHVILSGSEDFPYKEIPNLIADRSLESGIYTAVYTDYTSYTTETVIKEGFLALLPILGDYILFPLLREEAYTTEVHHITGEGEDAGVMYKDLQYSEESINRNLLSTFIKYIYPGGCSYASNTEGRTKNLRENINITKVRNYHKEYYRPENLKIIVMGNIKPSEVFKTLEKLEEKILSTGKVGSFQRPFQTPPSPLTKNSQDVLIKYPADDERKGHFYMTWRTVSCASESYTFLAILMLLEYLTESVMSPIFKEFVKNEDSPSRYVSYDVIWNKESCVCLVLENIPIEKLPQIKPKIQSVFKKLIENNDIDMKDMENIIRKYKMKKIINIENVGHFEVQFMIIKYIIYGCSENFQDCLNPLPQLDKLLEEPQSFWLELLQTYLVENKSVTAHCMPSREEKKSRIKEEKERIELQRQKLTETELKEKGELLERAIAWNERKPPPNMLITLPFPNKDSIKFQHIERYNSDMKSGQRIDLSQTPVYTYFDHMETSTAFLSVLLTTSNVPKHLQSYIPLLFDCLLELPIERDGVIIPHEEVKRQLEADTIYNWASSQCFNMPHMGTLVVEVGHDRYELGLQWLQELLYKSVFTVSRLKVVATETLAQLTGNTSNLVYLNAMCFSKDSPIYTQGELQMKKFLTDLIEKLDGNDSQQILDDINGVRKIITEPSQVVLYIAANLDHLTNAAEAIDEFLPQELEDSKNQQRLNPVFHYDFLQFDQSLNGCIIGVDKKYFVQRCRFLQATKGITSYSDPDYVALYLYIKYLEHDKGLLTKRIQKTAIWFHIEVDSGLITLNYSDTKNIVEIYKKTKEIIDKQLKTREWDISLLEIVRRAMACEIIDEESTFMDMVLLSRRSYFHNLDYTYNRKLFDSIIETTTEDLNRVGEKYISSLFDPKKTKTVIVAHMSKVDELGDEFKKLGMDLMVHSSEESFLNNL